MVSVSPKEYKQLEQERNITQGNRYIKLAIECSRSADKYKTNEQANKRIIEAYYLLNQAISKLNDAITYNRYNYDLKTARHMTEHTRK